MYHHIKKLMYTVEIGTPDPKFGNMLLEQFGGANGELAVELVEAPAFKEFVSPQKGTRSNGDGASTIATPKIVKKQR